MLKITDLSAGYRQKVIENISLNCAAASITTIFGPNGCGKSTLLKSIAGLCNVFSGDILWNEKCMGKLSARELAKKVTYLSQMHETPMITVERLVMHGRFPYLSYPRHYSKEDYALCEKAMKRTGIYSFHDKKMAELSGGQQQKVYLAMALVRDSEMILFDEPTTYLDIRYQLEFMDMMKELKEQGKTVIAVLHDIDFAMQFSDKIVLMNQGKIELTGSTEDIFKSQKIEKLFQIRVNQITDEFGQKHYFAEKI